MTEQQIEHLRKAHNKIQRGYQTIESYWKQDITDDDLTIIKNRLEGVLIDLRAFIANHKGDAK